MFTRPASPEVARLLGIPNLHDGVMAIGGEIDAHGALIRIERQHPGTRHTGAVERSTRACRSSRHGTSPMSHPMERHDTTLTGTLTDIADIGTSVDLFVALTEEVELEARTHARVDLEVGDMCRVELSAASVSLWPAPAPAPPSG